MYAEFTSVSLKYILSNIYVLQVVYVLINKVTFNYHLFVSKFGVSLNTKERIGSHNCGKSSRISKD